MDKDLLEFILKDDGLVIAETQLEEAKKQTGLLETIKEQTKPAVQNNWYTVLKLDLNEVHVSYQIWEWYDGHPLVNSIVIPAQEVDFEYELEPGKKITIDAGLIMDVTGHDIRLIRISNSETTNDVMDIILSGVDMSKV